MRSVLPCQVKLKRQTEFFKCGDETERFACLVWCHDKTKSQSKCTICAIEKLVKKLTHTVDKSVDCGKVRETAQDHLVQSKLRENSNWDTGRETKRPSLLCGLFKITLYSEISCKYQQKNT